MRLRRMAELCRHSRVPLPARFRRAGPQLPASPAPRHPCGWQIGGALRADISSAPPPYSWAALGLPPSLRQQALPSAASHRLQAGSQEAQGASAVVLLFRHGRLVILPAAMVPALLGTMAAFLPLATRACSTHGSRFCRHPAKPASVRLTLPPCLLTLSCLRLLLSPPTLRLLAQCRSLTLAAQPPRITTAPAVLDACCLGSPAGIAVATGFPRPAPASPVSSGNPPVDINHRI